MVRLVFRPYTQISRSICTSEALRASTRVSPGFALFRHSSPSFGSQHARSHSNLVPEETWSVDGAACASHLHSLSLRTGVFRPCTRGHVRLLGRPCFKTGRRKPFRQGRTASRRHATAFHLRGDVPPVTQALATLAGTDHDGNAIQRSEERRRSGTARH